MRIDPTNLTSKRQIKTLERAKRHMQEVDAIKAEVAELDGTSRDQLEKQGEVAVADVVTYDNGEATSRVEFGLIQKGNFKATVGTASHKGPLDAEERPWFVSKDDAVFVNGSIGWTETKVSRTQSDGKIVYRSSGFTTPRQTTTIDETTGIIEHHSGLLGFLLG